MRPRLQQLDWGTRQPAWLSTTLCTSISWTALVRNHTSFHSGPREERRRRLCPIHAVKDVWSFVACDPPPGAAFLAGSTFHAARAPFPRALLRARPVDESRPSRCQRSKSAPDPSHWTIAVEHPHLGWADVHAGHKVIVDKDFAALYGVTIWSPSRTVIATKPTAPGDRFARAERSRLTDYDGIGE